eukprot:gene6479-8912_t
MEETKKNSISAANDDGSTKILVEAINSEKVIASSKIPLSIEGWVSKRSDRLKQWRRRYAIIKDYQLSFSDSDSPEVVNPNKIDLRSCTCVKMAEKASLFSEAKDSIKLTTNTGNLYFFVKDAESRTQWFDILTNIITRSLNSIMLYGAIQENDSNQAEFLINNSIMDVNFTMPSTGFTLLGFAAESGCIDIVNLLIDAKCDVNMPNKFGNSPLFLATLKDQFDVLNILLTAGANVNQLNSKNKYSSLLAATDRRNTRALTTLIKAGADVNVQSKDRITALLGAVIKSSIDCVRILLECPGVDPNQQNKDGHSPLFVACCKGLRDISRLLINFPGINLNLGPKLHSPIHIAHIYGYRDIVRMLEEKGVQNTHVNEPVVGAPNTSYSNQSIDFDMIYGEDGLQAQFEQEKESIFTFENNIKQATI